MTMLDGDLSGQYSKKRSKTEVSQSVEIIQRLKETVHQHCVDRYLSTDSLLLPLEVSVLDGQFP
jgi:hypothetical protein